MMILVGMRPYFRIAPARGKKEGNKEKNRLDLSVVKCMEGEIEAQVGVA